MPAYNCGADSCRLRKEEVFQMGYCTNCGMEIKDGAKFCTNCGAPQKPATEEPHMQYAQPQPVQEDPWQSSSYDSAGTQDYAGSSFSSTGAENSYGSYSSSGSYTSADSSSGSYTGADSSYGSTGSYSGGSYSGSSAVSSDPVPGPNFMEAVQTCFSKYATFSGRARRSEYWYFTLFHVLAFMILGIIGNMIFGSPEGGGSNMLQNIFSLATFIPGLAVSCRRLHDIGKSGKWILISLVPVIGWIVLLVFEIKDSEPGENQYGRSPKYPM